LAFVPINPRAFALSAPQIPYATGTHSGNAHFCAKGAPVEHFDLIGAKTHFVNKKRLNRHLFYPFYQGEIKMGNKLCL
jgi:hypothetical protein